MYVYIYVCMYVCMYVCVYVCMYVCVCYATLRRQTVMGRIVTVKLFYSAVTLSMNNHITLFSYYIQLSATLCGQLRTIVHNAMRLFSTIVRS